MPLCALTQQQVATVRQCPLFFNISRADFLKILTVGGRLVRYEKNQRVRTEGRLPIVLEGQGCIKKYASDGHEILLDYIAPPRVVGIATLFLQNVALSRIFAVEPLLLLVFHKKEVEKILDGFPVFRTNYLSYLSDRIAFLTEKIAFLAGYGAEARLLTFIQDKADAQGNLSVSSFKGLAMLLNMSRASLYRALDNLKKQDHIKIDGHNIFLIRSA